MIVVGIAFIIFAALVGVFHMATVLAAAVVGVGMVLLGLLVGERWPTRRV